MKPLKVPKKGGVKRVAERLNKLGKKKPSEKLVRILRETGLLAPDKDVWKSRFRESAECEVG